MIIYDVESARPGRPLHGFIGCLTQMGLSESTPESQLSQMQQTWKLKKPQVWATGHTGLATRKVDS